MHSTSSTPNEYIENLPDDRKIVLSRLRNIMLENLPEGFAEGMGYGMIGYAVPHSIYPQGYHCDPKLPLPFISIASQKNFISFYHMGMYANADLLDWFVSEYPKHSKGKLDMGKSCVRFKKPDDIPFSLIGELATRMTVTDWISLYEQNLKR